MLCVGVGSTLLYHRITYNDVVFTEFYLNITLARIQ